jgi:NAD(P)-dependent dehydrogenase (short-subunit alcohol dehydrogenase family)
MAGKTVIVTGSNKGIGRGIVEDLLANCPEFSKVIMTARSMELGQATVNEINGDGRYNGRLFLQQLDISNADSIAAFVAQFTAEHGRVDVLCNNAGFAFKKADPFTYENGVYTSNINFHGTMNYTEAMMPHINDGGHIVIVGSRAGNIANCPSEEKKARLLSDDLTMPEVLEMEQSFHQSVKDDNCEEVGW